MRGDQQLARHCFIVFTEVNKPEDPLSIDKLDQRDSEERGKPAEQLVSIPLKEDDPTKTIQIRLQLSNPKRKQLIDLLRANANVFT